MHKPCRSTHAESLPPDPALFLAQDQGTRGLTTSDPGREGTDVTPAVLQATTVLMTATVIAATITAVAVGAMGAETEETRQMVKVVKSL